MDVLEIAKRAILKYSLCDSCLGRLFAQLGYALENYERGNAIKTVLFLKACADGDEEVVKALARSGYEPAVEYLRKNGVEVSQNPCYICGGTLSRIEELAKKIVDELRIYEFDTFVVGTTVTAEIAEREETLMAELGIKWGESIKTEVNRRVGRVIRDVLGKRPEFREPEVMVNVFIPQLTYTINVKPLFVYGRYRKVRRGVSQNPWIVHGRRKYITSVEEEVRKIIKSVVPEASEVFIHAAGREDVDARCIGSGRPLIIEVRGVKKRKTALSNLVGKVFRTEYVELEVFREASRKEVSELKEEARERRKVYRALIYCLRDVSEEELRRVEEELSYVTIEQRTPTRVLRRKPDKLRLKTLYGVKLRKVCPHIIEGLFDAQGGLYVKEVVTGDFGRTKPSLAELLGTETWVLELDILYVES